MAQPERLNVTHIKRRLLKQAAILFNCVPFQNRNVSWRKEFSPRRSEFVPLSAVPFGILEFLGSPELLFQSVDIKLVKTSFLEIKLRISKIFLQQQTTEACKKVLKRSIEYDKSILCIVCSLYFWRIRCSRLLRGRNGCRCFCVKLLKHLPVILTIVFIFSYSGPSGIVCSDESAVFLYCMFSLFLKDPFYFSDYFDLITQSRKEIKCLYVWMKSVFWYQ